MVNLGAFIGVSVSSDVSEGSCPFPGIVLAGRAAIGISSHFLLRLFVPLLLSLFGQGGRASRVAECFLQHI